MSEVTEKVCVCVCVHMRRGNTCFIINETCTCTLFLCVCTHACIQMEEHIQGLRVCACVSELVPKICTPVMNSATH